MGVEVVPEHILDANNHREINHSQTFCSFFHCTCSFVWKQGFSFDLASV